MHPHFAPASFTAVAALGLMLPGGVARPPVNAPADYQLGGAYRPAPGVRVVTRDHTARPAPRTYSICYLNAFQTQAGTKRRWLAEHPRLLLRDRRGRLVHDPGWPAEILLNTSTPRRRAVLARVAGRWISGCARHGFDAVEPDNLDSFTRSRGLLTLHDNLDYARLLVRRAHRHGLAVAQKNLAGLSRRHAHRAGFDFAVAEDCQVYNECGAYRRVYGRHVIEIEYADHGLANFHRACRLRGSAISVVYRDRLLRTPGHRHYVDARC